MRSYTIHLKSGGAWPQDGPVLIKEGFNWPAAAFTVVWALWSRLWWPAGIIFVFGALLTVVADLLGADQIIQTAASIGLAIIVGYCANDWHRIKLRRAGFHIQGVVVADNLDGARRRCFDRLASPG